MRCRFGGVWAGMAAAAVVGVSGFGCSDSGGGGKLDAAKLDAAKLDGRADVVAADAPRVDTLPDSAAADSPAVDAPIADRPASEGGTPDAPAGETGRADAVDAPAGEAGVVDGGVGDGGDPVARGKYLVDNVIACSDCHTPKLPSGAPDMTRYLAGDPGFVRLPTGDVLASRNLTPDRLTGLGQYTADQIKHMFMDGIVPDATGTHALNPIMPYYVFHNMASEDADAIVAYLQSIPAVSNPLPDRSPAFDVAAPADYLDPATIPAPAASYPQRASAMHGRYLATESGLCIECHTPHLASGPKPIDTTKYFQGGEDFSNLFAGTLNIHPVSANLTSDPTTGLGNWTTDQIVTVLKQGTDDHGDGICPPMPVGPSGAYCGMTAQDALDIANYIKSLPPAVNDVPDMCSWPPAPPIDGGAIDGRGLDTGALDGTGG